MKNKNHFNTPQENTEINTGHFNEWEDGLDAPQDDTTTDEKPKNTQQHEAMLHALHATQVRNAKREAYRVVSGEDEARRDQPKSQIRAFGRALARFVKRAINASRSSAPVANQSLRQPMPRSINPSNFQPTVASDSKPMYDKRRAMLLDAAEQYHTANRKTKSNTESTSGQQPEWTGGLTMDGEGNVYYKPADNNPSKQHEPNKPEETDSSPVIESSAEDDRAALDAANAAYDAAVKENARRAKTRQDRADFRESERARRRDDTAKTAEESNPHQQETNSSQHDYEAVPATPAGEFIASTTSPENMNEVLASFDPNKNYTYEEAMKMIPDKKGYRNYWENSVIGQHNPNSIEGLDQIARALLVKDIHENIGKIREAIAAGRLEPGTKVRGNLGTVIGKSGIGSEYIRQKAARRGMVPADTNSFSAESMSFSELAKLVDIDTSSIEGYDEVYG